MKWVYVFSVLVTEETETRAQLYKVSDNNMIRKNMIFYCKGGLRTLATFEA